VCSSDLREALIPAFRLFQHELELVDAEIDERYFSGVASQGAAA